MNIDEFRGQLDQAIALGFQRVIGLRIEDTEAGPQAVFRVGREA
jgi:hypothetical protein